MLDEAVLIKKMYSLASTYMIHVIMLNKYPEASSILRVEGQGTSKRKVHILGVTWLSSWGLYIEIIYLGDESQSKNLCESRVKTYITILPDSVLPDRLPVDARKN